MYFFIFIFGILIGNFATSLLYRLPRDITLFGFIEDNTRPPFCSTCFHILKFYEYLPILSWISTRGRCNYCNNKINPLYTYLEVSCGFFAIICTYLYYPNIDIFFLKFCFCAISSLQIAIYSEHRKIYSILTATLIVEAAIFRTLQDQSIMSWLTALCFAGIFCAFLFQKISDKSFSKELVHIILPSLVCLEGYGLILFAIILAIFIAIRTLNKFSKTHFYSLCMSINLLLFYYDNLTSA